MRKTGLRPLPLPPLAASLAGRSRGRSSVRGPVAPPRSSSTLPDRAGRTAAAGPSFRCRRRTGSCRRAATSRAASRCSQKPTGLDADPGWFRLAYRLKARAHSSLSGRLQTVLGDQGRTSITRIPGDCSKYSHYRVVEVILRGKRFARTEFYFRLSRFSSCRNSSHQDTSHRGSSN